MQSADYVWLCAGIGRETSTVAAAGTAASQARWSARHVRCSKTKHNAVFSTSVRPAAAYAQRMCRPGSMDVAGQLAPEVQPTLSDLYTENSASISGRSKDVVLSSLPNFILAMCC
jgi:hypothetical protein